MLEQLLLQSNNKSVTDFHFLLTGRFSSLFRRKILSKGYRPLKILSKYAKKSAPKPGSGADDKIAHYCTASRLAAAR